MRPALFGNALHFSAREMVRAEEHDGRVAGPESYSEPTRRRFKSNCFLNRKGEKNEQAQELFFRSRPRNKSAKVQSAPAIGNNSRSGSRYYFHSLGCWS